MRSLLYRISSLGLRFGCPLLILYISTPDILGAYYLFVTFFTAAIFLISLELATPFSSKYLRVRAISKKRKIFSIMITNQCIVALFLALPLTFCYCMTNAISPLMAFFFWVTLITGACVNETGRFFWNIGESVHASKRDILSSITFVFAITLSVFLKKEVVTFYSLGFITLSNLGLLHFELNHWGQGSFFRRFNFGITRNSCKHVFKQIYSSLKDSGPQVLHVQILSVSPFCERTLIENTLGLALVGSYSFQFSLLQSGVSLLLMPMIAKVRCAILSSRTLKDQLVVYKLSLLLLMVIFLVSSVGALITYFFVPYINIILKKEITSNFLILGAALFSATSSSYCNAIAPLFGNRTRLFVANTLTLICMFPLLLFISDRFKLFFPHTIYSIMVIIGLTALLQVGVRLWFHFNALIHVSKIRKETSLAFTLD